ncbi:MAG TPA: c-type cytochrome domain-containing protein, partial [Bryobacteraceae bacterium]|nr:c-type cytochrome domain-containing protein [Bryobacteraceae bacterium]
MSPFRAARIAVCSATLLAFAVSTGVPAQNRVDFAKDVQPILEKSCYSCHGAKLQMGGLRLDSKAAAFQGGQSGKTIQPGDAAGSILYQRVAGLGDQARMPMGAKPLDAAEIGRIRSWIEQGATWPDGIGSAGSEVKKHWAFVAPKRPAPPKVSRPGWVRNPIDAFILARLEQEGLQPSPEADKVTLLRRLSLDLTGL